MDGAAIESGPNLIIYHLVIFQRGPRGEIDRSLVRAIQGLLAEKVTTPPPKTHIVVWLDTPGGDPHATYKLFLELRGRADRVDVLVPDYAKSAGTLLALGCDRIYMGVAAELGPLDAQIGHPDREEIIVSALDVAGSLEHLARMAVGITIAGGASALINTGLPRGEVFKNMLSFASSFLEPAVAKLDPHMIHRASAQLQVARRYAVSMLAGRKGATEPMQDHDADQLLQRLVEEYPEHGYVISRDEAKRLGLPVFPGEDHPRWGMAEALLRGMVANRKTLLNVMSDEELMKLAEEGEAHGESTADADSTPTDETRGGSDPSVEEAGPARDVSPPAASTSR